VKRRWIDGLYLVVPPLGYMALSMTSHLDIGVRHIMPVFPFFAVMGAAAVTAFLNIKTLRNSRFSTFTVCLLVAWIIAIAVATFPYYTTYFSPLAGGPKNGWRLLSDSNVETGQDVKELAAFLKERGENQVEGLFVGSGYIEYYGVENCEIPCGSDTDNDNEEAGGDGDLSQSDEQSPEPDSTEAPPKYIAIGAWYLEEIDLTPEQRAVIDQYRSAQPEAVIGNAIFVFQRKQN
jgi:hypothetical protein